MNCEANPLWLILSVDQGSTIASLHSTGQGLLASWSIPDPSHGEGREERAHAAARTVPCYWRNTASPFVRPPGPHPTLPQAGSELSCTHGASRSFTCCFPRRKSQGGLSLSLSLARRFMPPLCCPWAPCLTPTLAWSFLWALSQKTGVEISAWPFCSCKILYYSERLSCVCLRNYSYWVAKIMGLTEIMQVKHLAERLQWGKLSGGGISGHSCCWRMSFLCLPSSLLISWFLDLWLGREFDSCHDTWFWTTDSPPRHLPASFQSHSSPDQHWLSCPWPYLHWHHKGQYTIHGNTQ